MRRGSAALACALALVCAGCGAARLTLPAGPGVPAPDAREVVTAATAACSPLSAVSMEMAVSGSIAGGRVRGRLLGGLTRDGGVRLEAVAPAGQPVFILATGAGSAQRSTTLVLPRDNRVLENGQFKAVLEAVTGIPIDAPVLFAVLTGCPPSAPADGNALGDDWRLVRAGGYDVYVHRDKSARWRLAATVDRDTVSGWRVEYLDAQNDLPRTIRLVSTRPNGFDLQLTLSQVDVNPSLGAEVFRVRLPPTAAPITLDELKTEGPLAANAR
jgi:hypothetical protein